MEKLYRTVNIDGTIYNDIIEPKEMTEAELLQTIAPVEIPKLRGEIERLQAELNHLRAENVLLRDFIVSIDTWHETNKPNYPEYFEEDICEGAAQILAEIPQTDKIQTVLDAATEWKKLMNESQNCMAVIEEHNLYEAVRAREE